MEKEYHSILRDARIETESEPLKDDEMRALFKKMKHFDIENPNNATFRLAVLLMLDTGMSLSDMVSLKANDLDFSVNVIRYRDKKMNKRLVFFGTLSEDELMINAKQNDVIFWDDEKNEPMTEDTIRDFLNRISAELKAPDREAVTPERLQKTFIFGMLKLGCPVKVVRRLIGVSEPSKDDAKPSKTMVC